MKVEVGKFYKTRGGEKVGPMEKKSYGWIAGNGRIEPLDCIDWYDDGNYNYYHAPSEHDLIEEWKEPEVKEPKFKVGDRITWGSKQVSFVVESFSKKEVCFVPESGLSTRDNQKIFDYHKATKIDDDFMASVEVLEPTKPEITVNSRWTFTKDDNFVVEIVHVNANKLPVLKVITKGKDEDYEVDDFFEFTGRGGITFLELYKPYVEPPKTLVGYVGVIEEENGLLYFTDTYNTESQLRDEWCEIIAIKKIEWTEGE